MSEELGFNVEGTVARVRLQRGAKLNALTPGMLAALVVACDTIEADASVRCLILEGEGKAFCAGADIQAWSSLRPMDMWRRWIIPGHNAFDRFAGLRVPTIAVVGGACLGGGLELALCCDLRVASAQATFAMPEVAIGTMPGWGGTERLARAVGSARARQMILTGERIDAATADAWGLVASVHQGTHAREEAERLAAVICSRAPVAVAAAKLALAAQDGDRPTRALEALGGALAAATDDAAEGIASFREKRPPAWKGT